MGKAKAWLEDEAEKFLSGVEEEVKSGKISVTEGLHKCKDAPVSWSMIGFESYEDLEEYFATKVAKAGDPRILEIQGVVWFLTQDLAWEYYHFQKEELKNKQLAYCKSENDLHLHFNTNSDYIKTMKTKTRLTKNKDEPGVTVGVNI